MIVDIARIDPYEVADACPDTPILGYTNHTDTYGLRASARSRTRPVVARSALAERAPQLVDELVYTTPARRMTYIIAEPCIDIKDLSCVDVCPVDCIHVFDRMLIIDPEECIDCGACEPECPVEAIFPEDALPEKWEPFVKINYAYGDGADVINKLVDEYATEHNVQNPPLDQQ